MNQTGCVRDANKLTACHWLRQLSLAHSESHKFVSRRLNALSHTHRTHAQARGRDRNCISYHDIVFVRKEMIHSNYNKHVVSRQNPYWNGHLIKAHLLFWGGTIMRTHHPQKPVKRALSRIYNMHMNINSIYLLTFARFSLSFSHSNKWNDSNYCALIAFSVLWESFSLFLCVWEVDLAPMYVRWKNCQKRMSRELT